MYANFFDALTIMLLELFENIINNKPDGTSKEMLQLGRAKRIWYLSAYASSEGSGETARIRAGSPEPSLLA